MPAESVQLHFGGYNVAIMPEESGTFDFWTNMPAESVQL